MWSNLLSSKSWQKITVVVDMLKLLSSRCGLRIPEENVKSVKLVKKFLKVFAPKVTILRWRDEVISLAKLFSLDNGLYLSSGDL